jgi:membrane-associated phospholipid phosphatase
MRSLAQFISYVIHPSFMPVLGVFLIIRNYAFYLSPELQKRLLLIVVTGTYLLPLIFSLALWRLGYIESLLMKKRSDRRAPFIIGGVFFYFTAQLMQGVEAIPLLYVFLLAAATTVLIQLIFLQKTKISAHTAGISGLISLSVFLAHQGEFVSTHLVAILILTGGLVGWARLKLEAHSLSEVIWGYLAGSVPLGLLYVVWL